MNIALAKDWINQSTQVVGFSGAGISTASGIPDFRSPEGIWAKNRTVTYQEFMQDKEDRIEYWRQKYAIWPEIRKAKPNAGHQSFVHLFEKRKLLGLITQNIDGLHQKAGLPNEKVIEIHGTTIEVACLKCSRRISMERACARIKAGDLAPACDACGGYLKPATISFGQSMPGPEMDRAIELSENCDVFIAVGSSLVVHPAAGFPVLAKKNGAKLIIVNREPTPLDEIADQVFHAEIDKVLPLLVN